jgi:hypothetical protein
MAISSRTAALIALMLLAAGCRRKYEEELGPDAGRFERSRLWSYPDEAWDDPAVQQEARLQFIWGSPDEKIASIFSLNLKGEDLRRVIGPDHLYTGEAKVLKQKPVRSPNRRYIACFGEDAQNNELRFLVDLKTRTVRTLLKARNVLFNAGGGFSWTPDSRGVLFRGEDELLQYDVETGTLHAVPNIGPFVEPVDGGRSFLSLRERAVELRDPAGKLLKRIELPYRPASPQTDSEVSDDGRFITFRGVPLVIFDLEKPDKPVFSSRELFFSPTFAPDGRTLFFFTADLNALDLASGEVRSLGQLPGAQRGSFHIATAATTLLPVRAR